MGSGFSGIAADIAALTSPGKTWAPAGTPTTAAVAFAVSAVEGFVFDFPDLCSVITSLPTPEALAQFMCGKTPDLAQWLISHNFPEWLVTVVQKGEAFCEPVIAAGGRALLAEVKSFCKKGRPRPGGNMACSNTHSSTSKVQGPGICCAALSKSGIAPAVGVRVQATTRTGKCMICEIKASTSQKHPGALVFKRGRSAGAGASCPTSQQGCCVLQTVAAQA